MELRAVAGLGVGGGRRGRRELVCGRGCLGRDGVSEVVVGG
jgi:hypothetical protein